MLEAKVNYAMTIYSSPNASLHNLDFW
jgi:hypothetical protein